jgi:hypothetical protein
MTSVTTAHHHHHPRVPADHLQSDHHRAETLPEASGPGTVVVDIGGDIGAAAVQVAVTLDGSELEIRAVGDEWAGIHVAVRERPMPSGAVYAALFPALAAGDYEIRVKSDATSYLGRFSVVGGRVTSYTVS